MNTTTSTAIVLFANSAEKELEQKKMPGCKKLFRTLTETTLLKAQKSGLPVYHVSEEQQRGNNFGERFIHTLGVFFNKGYDSLIIIGNDTPQLSTQHLTQTKQQLSAGKTVFGPSVDGGFYLIGIHKADFTTETFLHLPWQQSNLYDVLHTWSQSKSLSTYSLPVFRDIDVFEDLHKLTSFYKTIPFKVYQLICKLLSNPFNTTAHRFLGVAQKSTSVLCNKGSPYQMILN